MADTDLFTVRVMQITWCSPSVLAFTLAAPDGNTLPGFQAGAHVSVHLPIEGKQDRVRAYSLIHTDTANDSALAQSTYRIAVRRDDMGAGGSLQLHQHVRPGDVLRISQPKNEFELSDTQNALLLAGGIGITPILSMATELHRRGVSFDCIYATRNRTEAVLLDELQTLCSEHLHVHIDDQAGQHLNILEKLRQTGPRPVYVCGPKAMIDATVNAAAQLGWPANAVRFELFGADAGSKAQAGYEVVLQFSDKTLLVKPGQALLDALIDEDVDIPYDCRAGFCGLCRIKVLEGDVNHHDTCLSEADRHQRGYMQACVSHAACSRLVLDL